jgi:hypothetical protein
MYLRFNYKSFMYWTVMMLPNFKKTSWHEKLWNFYFFIIFFSLHWIVFWRLDSSQCCGSEIIFSDPDPTLTLISDPDSNPYPAYLWKIRKKFRWSKHCKKARLLRKINLNCRSSKHCKKANFFKIWTFLQLCIVSWKQNLTWIRIKTRIRNRIRNWIRN